MQLILVRNDVAHLGKSGRKLRAQTLNQNPVKISDFGCSTILYFFPDPKIHRIIYFPHPENMPMY